MVQLTLSHQFSLEVRYSTCESISLSLNLTQLYILLVTSDHLLPLLTVTQIQQSLGGEENPQMNMAAVAWV